MVLVLQGLRWLLQGHDVHVVSTRSATLASSVMIQHQLQMTLKADGKAHRDAGAVRLHRYDLYVSEADVDAAVRDLSAAVKEGHLHVIVDEASFENKLVVTCVGVGYVSGRKGGEGCVQEVGEGDEGRVWRWGRGRDVCGEGGRRM